MKTEITIYKDGSVSGTDMEFGKVVVDALKNPHFKCLVLAALETRMFADNPLEWMMAVGPKQAKETLSKVAEKLQN